jgi:diguanylate cyclase (GGDEF)-like protein
LRKYIATRASVPDRFAPFAFFRKLKIARKMLVGYLTMALVTVAVVVYALVSLQRINNLNETIVKVDIVIQGAADKMVDSLLAQDAYEKRFLLLGTEDMVNLFWKRGKEYAAWLESLHGLPGQSGLDIGTIDNLSRDYTRLFQKEIELFREKKVALARGISNRELKATLEDLTRRLRSAAAYAKRSQDGKMQQIAGLGRTAFATTASLCALGVLVGAIAAFLVTRHISSSVSRLTDATSHFAQGDFTWDPQITSEDEIGRLSLAFRSMGQRLKKLEEMSLDASPLTRLPGGIAIERALQKRIDSRLPLAFCLMDLSNFKAFNDHYGYANGSEVIKKTAGIIEASVASRGTRNDFIGHVGGDDFVVITTPGAMHEVAGAIISEFDRQVPEFYSREDQERRYILGTTRQGATVRFPLMTISIAIVTNERRKLSNPAEVSEIAAEVKNKAKKQPRSSYLIDKRGTK